MEAPPGRRAYEDLLARYLPALRRLAWSYTRHGQAEAEDLMQEIAMALWTALPRFRGESNERTWLYRVAHNTAISFVTMRVRRANHEAPPAHTESPSDSASPEGEAIESQRRARLQTAVAALKMPDRQIVLLYLEGLSAREIEDVTGLSAGNVATRLTRTRQKLKEAILCTTS